MEVRAIRSQADYRAALALVAEHVALDPARPTRAKASASK